MKAALFAQIVLAERIKIMGFFHAVVLQDLGIKCKFPIISAQSGLKSTGHETADVTSCANLIC